MMLTTTQEEEEVWCECSDDETYNPGKMKPGTWQPKAEDMLRLFDELKTKKVLELSWKCPGRRPPESEVKKEEEIKQEPITTPPKHEEKKQVTPSKFDFDDDMNEPKAVLTPRWTPGSTPRPQKKVARMDKVLKDMMQQRKQQAAEREARKLAKSPRAPGSPSRARLGSPASSPRTPPVSQQNRQSPVRSVAPTSEAITTTPLRALVDSESTPGKMPMQIGDIFAAGSSSGTPQSTPTQSTASRLSQPGLHQNRPPSQTQTSKLKDGSSPAVTGSTVSGTPTSAVKPAHTGDGKPAAGITAGNSGKPPGPESMDTS